MPTYQFTCQKCMESIEAYRQVDFRDSDPPRCQQCKTEMKRDVVSTSSIHVFKPYWHRNLDVKDIYIENRKQEKHEFRSRNLIDAR